MKKRNPIAAALRNASLRPKIISDKRRKLSKRDHKAIQKMLRQLED